MILPMQEEDKPKRKRKPKKIRYIGNGAYLSGIPAKDMTLKEWEKIPKERRQHAIKLGLYKE